MTQLIITNGDQAADLLREAGIGDTILPWRDVLHEGPIPDADDTIFAKIRAQTLADGQIITEAKVIEDFKNRQEILNNHQQYDTIELWFEHDLYDQLQILQILDTLGRLNRINNVTLVQSPAYLSMQPVEKIGKLQGLALPVLDRMFAFASRTWKAYISGGPTAINEIRQDAIPGFPFMGQALTRLLQELPGLDGLSRTERQCLYRLNRGVNRPGMLFAQVLNMEEAAFLGDWGFFKILSNLQFCSRPALTGLPQNFKPGIFQDDAQRKEFITSQLHITDFGKSLLEHKADFIAENGLHRWWGGTELTTADHWRWQDDDEILSHHQAS
nr:DUF1835 domain-containing protein [uncultured Cohaesibacter sp.]